MIIICQHPSRSHASITMRDRSVLAFLRNDPASGSYFTDGGGLMPANHTPTPAQSWIVRLARVCWERKKLSVIVVVASVSTILLAALTPLLTRQAVNDALAGNPAR
ncbi:TPA: hypothetical protein IG007_004751, partial [Escherichia coli]|nr:hypothetical protein [Escherichia coli]